MNPDELRMILETVKDVASTAGWVGVVWVLVHYLVLIVQSVAIPVALCYGAIKVFPVALQIMKTPRVIENVWNLRGISIDDAVKQNLEVQLSRLKFTSYIHQTGADKLGKALDEYERSTGKKLSDLT